MNNPRITTECAEDGRVITKYFDKSDPELRPSGLIHYFNQEGNYIESAMILELQERKVFGKFSNKEGVKSFHNWSSTGRNIQKQWFDINTIIYPDDEINNVFWGAIKEGFKKREPRVKTDYLHGEYNFIVQYLVKQKR